jgi:hypothetical protein
MRHPMDDLFLNAVAPQRAIDLVTGGVNRKQARERLKRNNFDLYRIGSAQARQLARKLKHIGACGRKMSCGLKFVDIIERDLSRTAEFTPIRLAGVRQHFSPKL